MAPFRFALAVAALPLLLNTAPALAEAPLSIRDYPPLEVKLGGLLHDIDHRNHPASRSLDLNLEVLSRPLPIVTTESTLLQAIVSPRAMLGATVNTEGNTHSLYAGVSWIYPTGTGVFIAPSVGLAVHTGHLRRATRPCTTAELLDGCAGREPAGQIFTNGHREALGTRVLFRESLEVGYTFANRVSLGVYAAHMSNAGLGHRDNGGMSFVGLRLGTLFGGG